MVPRGTAKTDIVARLFSNFRELAGILSRHKEQAYAREEGINKHRHLRRLMPGEVVFRRMPWKARPAKHLLGEPSAGPYVVVSQTTFSSARLKDPATGEWVDDGVDIPLEQLLVGPRRSLLKFEPSQGDRSIGQMMAGDASANLPAEVKAAGWKSSKKKGWKGLVKGQVVAYQSGVSRELSVAYVLFNDRNNQSIEAQSCRSTWTGAAVCHRKEYRKSDAEGSEIVLEPTEEPVRCTIFYRALVKVCLLYTSPSPRD